MYKMKKFLFGLEFFRYPGPSPEELKKDLDRFHRDGVSLIRIQTNWAYEEPREGEYDFHRITDLLSYADALGMEVIVTVCLENAPPWLFIRYRAYPVNARGEAVRHSLPYPVPGDGKPGPCFDHPDARAAAERYAKNLVTTLSEWDCVIGWSVWQEARTMGGIPLAEGETLCWCEHTQAAFRGWLQKKYEGLDGINRALRTNYGILEDIEAPYLLYQNMKQNPLYFAYADFLTERLGGIAAWKAALVRRYDPKERPVMQHTVQGMVETGIGGQWADEYVLARETDIFGASLYPKWGTAPFEKDEDTEAVILSLDAVRCAADGRPVLAAELQMGRPGSLLERSVTPSEQDIINWVLLCLARGARGVIGWSYRDETFCLESYGHGVLDALGRPHAWYGAVPRLAAFLKKHAALFAALSPSPAKAAILVNRSNYLLGHAADREDLPVQSARNIYLMLARRGVQADFLRPEQLMPERLSSYGTVWLPFPLVLEGSTALLLQLRSYVRGGGHLIAECCPGSYEPSSCADPEKAETVLRELFGCEQESIYEVGDPAVCPVLEPCNAPGSTGCEGRKLQAVHFVETYRCLESLDTGPLYTCRGMTAACRRTYGKGTADIIGTFFGADPANEEAAAALAGLGEAEDLLFYELRQPLFYEGEAQSAAAERQDAGSEMQGTGSEMQGIGSVPQDSAAVRSHAYVIYNRTKETKQIRLPAGESLIDSMGGMTVEEDGTRIISLGGKSAACLVVQG